MTLAHWSDWKSRFQKSIDKTCHQSLPNECVISVDFWTVVVCFVNRLQIRWNSFPVTVLPFHCLKCSVWSDAKKSFDIDFSRGFNRLFHLFEQPKSTYPPNKVIAPNFILGSTVFERGIGNILSTLPRKLMKPKAKYCALRQELAFSMNADILWHLRFFTLIGTDKRIERLSKRYFLKSVRMQTQAIKSKVPLLIRRSEKVCLNLIYWPSV